MPLNKSSIEWCTHTWNPVTGCYHDCPYCYARSIARRFGERVPDYSGYSHEHPGRHCLDTQITNNPYPYIFEPTLHAYRLGDPAQHKTPARVFVGSMCDLFGEWAPEEWIEEVFRACAAAPWHTYLFLTKNPRRYIELVERGIIAKQPNMWFGSTITTAEDLFFWNDQLNTFVSIEPLLGPLGIADESEVKRADWVIIGAMTGPKANKHQPERAWVEDICTAADMVNVPVFMKDSLIPIMGEGGMRREYPAGMPLGAHN